MVPGADGAPGANGAPVVFPPPPHHEMTVEAAGFLTSLHSWLLTVCRDAVPVGTYLAYVPASASTLDPAQLSAQPFSFTQNYMLRQPGSRAVQYRGETWPVYLDQYGVRIDCHDCVVGGVNMAASLLRDFGLHRYLNPSLPWEAVRMADLGVSDACLEPPLAQDPGELMGGMPVPAPHQPRVMYPPKPPPPPPPPLPQPLAAASEAPGAPGNQNDAAPGAPGASGASQFWPRSAATWQETELGQQQLCRCGLAVEVCGACGLGWAQRAQFKAAPAYKAPPGAPAYKAPPATPAFKAPPATAPATAVYKAPQDAKELRSNQATTKQRSKQKHPDAQTQGPSRRAGAQGPNGSSCP